MGNVSLVSCGGTQRAEELRDTSDRLTGQEGDAPPSRAQPREGCLSSAGALEQMRAEYANARGGRHTASQSHGRMCRACSSASHGACSFIRLFPAHTLTRAREEDLGWGWGLGDNLQIELCPQADPQYNVTVKHLGHHPRALGPRPREDRVRDNSLRGLEQEPQASRGGDVFCQECSKFIWREGKRGNEEMAQDRG